MGSTRDSSGQQNSREEFFTYEPPVLDIAEDEPITRGVGTLIANQTAVRNSQNAGDNFSLRLVGFWNRVNMLPADQQNIEGVSNEIRRIYGDRIIRGEVVPRPNIPRLMREIRQE